jgi:hypothetical protein
LLSAHRDPPKANLPRGSDAVTARSRRALAPFFKVGMILVVRDVVLL